MSSNDLPLSGRTALVTGVSRRRGIGFATATTLAALGANVFIHHYRPHDLDHPWGGDDLDAVRRGIADALTPGAIMGDAQADLRDAATIEPLLDTASALTGTVDILVCNQAMSGSDGSIFDMTADSLDAHWGANARSSLLLTAGLARRHLPDPQVEPGAPRRPHPISRPVRAPGITRTVAAELLDVGLVLNTVNPGPVNTGYLDAESTDRDLTEFEKWLPTTPFGRVGRPEDPARLIGWLCTDAGSWVVGQVLTTDGGFSVV